LFAAVSHDGCEIIRRCVDQHIERCKIDFIREVGTIIIFSDLPEKPSGLLGDAFSGFVEDARDFLT
jgi:hypothetical protein